MNWFKGGCFFGLSRGLQMITTIVKWFYHGIIVVGSNLGLSVVVDVISQGPSTTPNRLSGNSSFRRMNRRPTQDSALQRDFRGYVGKHAFERVIPSHVQLSLTNSFECLWYANTRFGRSHHLQLVFNIFLFLHIQGFFSSFLCFYGNAAEIWARYSWSRNIQLSL